MGAEIDFVLEHGAGQKSRDSCSGALILDRRAGRQAWDGRGIGCYFAEAKRECQIRTERNLLLVGGVAERRRKVTAIRR